MPCQISGGELNCLASVLVINFAVSTQIVGLDVPPPTVHSENKEMKLYRIITKSKYYETPGRIHKSHGALFDKLKHCVRRHCVFLKRSENRANHDAEEYVDIEAILAQGQICVD